MTRTWNDIVHSKTPYVIAEIGVNFFDIAQQQHVPPIDGAKLMIQEALHCGCDAVKFQSYKADKIASVHSPSYWDLTEEATTSQHALFKKFDSFGHQEFQHLKNYCDEIGITFLSTPFDFEAADYLNPWMPFFKISSSDITNLPFIEHIAKKKKPIILSTGASTIDEVAQAVEVIASTGLEDINLMHCMLSYPTKNQDANLNVLDHLRSAFPNLSLGYSDHTCPDPSMLILTAAYLKGAVMIEKHFTLDKTLPGNDHYHAAEPSDFKTFQGNMALMSEVLGHDQRITFECEALSKQHARRSLVINQDLSQGQILDPSMIEIKRPGTGIQPKYHLAIMGSTLLEHKKKDDLLQWNDLSISKPV